MKKLNTVIMAALLAILGVFVSGCGNSEINIVKDGMLGNYNSLTVGKALDNYSYFATKEWKVIETENGRKFVEFRATYDVEPLFKNTDLKQFYLVIQFLINADKKSFEFSYIGRENVLKDGKVKNRKLGYCADNIFNNIYQNEDMMSLVAPAVIKCKSKRFNNKTIGEILDNYKHFKSATWNSSNISFTGILKLDNNAKESDIKQLRVKYSVGKFELAKEYSDGQEKRFSLSYRHDKDDFMQVIMELDNNKTISPFNSYPRLCRGSFNGQSYFGNDENIKELVLAKIRDRLEKGKTQSNSAANKSITSLGQPITKLKMSFDYYLGVNKVDEHNKKSYNSAKVLLQPQGDFVYIKSFPITYTVQLDNNGQPHIKILSGL